MKKLGELMRREPTEAEREAMAHVVELAQAWERGEISLESVGRQCSGHERWQAMRFADLGSDGKKALMALVDAFVEADPVIQVTKHGTMPREDFFTGYVKAATNWRGERVFVWPMHFMNGEPYYPLVHLEPGEKRRASEDAMREDYRRYQEAKKRGQSQPFRRAS